jgi:hypothetical protein
MSAESVIQKARAAGVELTVKGDRIRYRGLQSAIDELLPLLRANKPELLRLLTDRPACSGCRNLRMAEAPVPGVLPPYRFVWCCAKGHIEHGHTTPDLRILVAPDSCLAAGDHKRAFAKQGEAA